MLLSRCRQTNGYSGKNGWTEYEKRKIQAADYVSGVPARDRTSDSEFRVDLVQVLQCARRDAVLLLEKRQLGADRPLFSDSHPGEQAVWRPEGRIYEGAGCHHLPDFLRTAYECSGLPSAGADRQMEIPLPYGPDGETDLCQPSGCHSLGGVYEVDLQHHLSAEVGDPGL